MPHGKYNTYNKCVKNVKSTDCFQNQNDYPKMKSTNEGLLSASVQGGLSHKRNVSPSVCPSICQTGEL